MKKIVLSLLACALFVVSANAQTAIEGKKFFDNWSVGLNVGGATALHNGSFHPVIGIGVDKKLNTVVGFGLEFSSAFNTTQSLTAFDNTNLMLINNLNLMNLFAGYKGSPRVFEIESVLGIGWLHYYYNQGRGNDYNDLSMKAGLNLNFNLGESKAWTLALKPAFVWDAEKSGQVRLNANDASFEFTVGVRYHFMCSNGQHYFTRVAPPCDPDEIAALNDQINKWRKEAGDNKALADKNARDAAEIQRAFDEYKRTHPDVVAKNVPSMNAVVIFRQNSSTIDANQAPTVASIAKYLKDNDDTNVVLLGYASPEGSQEFNEALSQKRADAVKNSLVNDYGIAEDRIQTEGKGVGDVFEKATWNRACICIVAE